MTSLAGTTTDHKTKPIVADNLKYFNTQAWSGGVSDQQNGSATMHYSMKNVTGSSLEARKSWFFFKRQNCGAWCRYHIERKLKHRNHCRK